jgi:hypothetical protein
LKLYPFSIKKNTNIFGIIFGAKHPLAVDKFLNIVWKKDSISGQANFDIEDVKSNGQIDLFLGKKLNRVEEFQNALEEKILNSEIQNNRDALQFAHSEGHIGTHASEKIKLMKASGIIDYPGKSPLVTYDNVYKDKKIITYTKTK